MIMITMTYMMAMWMTAQMMHDHEGLNDEIVTYLTGGIIRVTIQGGLCILVGMDVRFATCHRVARKIISNKMTWVCVLLTMAAWFAPIHSHNTEWFPVQRTTFVFPINDVTDNVGVFNAFSGVEALTAKRQTIGPDSFSDITLISQAKVDPSWKQFSLPPISLVGIGGKPKESVVKAVMVPLRLQWGAPITHIVAYVAETPQDVDILMGKDVLKFLQANIDCGADRLIVKSQGMCIPTTSIAQNNARVNTRPLTIMSTCSGCNLVYSTFRNLGFDIKQWISIESDEVCREVTQHIVPKHVLYTPTSDINKIPEGTYKTHVDIHINTSPCQSFSRLQDAPLGFRDKARTDPMRSAAKLHRRLKSVNPDIKMMVENVEFHSSLQSDFHQFQKMWNGTAISLNANTVGSPSSRPRQFITDIVDIEQIDKIDPLSPNEILDRHRHCQQRSMKCIVASPHTRSIPMVMDHSLGQQDRLTIQECERMMGWPPDITKTNNSDGDYRDRLRRIGNALNAHHCHHILKHYTINNTTCRSYSTRVEEMSTAEFEKFLSNMTKSDMAKFVKARRGNYEPIPLRLELKDDAAPYAKPRRGFSTQAGLVESKQYMIQQQIDKGYLRKVNYRHGMFVSQGFVQAKPGRMFPGTNIPMCRLLVDCRNLNNACKDAPAHHNECCPSQLDMSMRVPFGSKCHKYYDLSDAHHTCKIHENCTQLVTVQFDDEFYEYIGGAQGIAKMAIHWNIHLMDIFDKIVANHWRDWYTLYCDDLGVHAANTTQLKIRSMMLEVILEEFEKPFSDKTNDEMSPTLDIAGMTFSEKGVRLSDDAFKALEECLREYTVKTARDIGHVVGVIQYANSAFEWPGMIAKARYSDLISTLNTVQKEPPKKYPHQVERDLPSH